MDEKVTVGTSFLMTQMVDDNETPRSVLLGYLKVENLHFKTFCRPSLQPIFKLLLVWLVSHKA